MIQRIFSVIITFFIIITLTSCYNKKAGPAASAIPQIVSVDGLVVSPQRVDNKIFTTGTILANEEVEIRSELSGRIVQINFMEGNKVDKGDLLVKINDDELQAQLKKLQLDESLAKEDVYRKSKLLEINAVSQEEYDVSQNQLGVIQANIELLKSQIDKTAIYAPFSGQIGLRYVSAGGYISSDNLIARLQQVDPIKIEFSVPEKYFSKLDKGSSIMFRIDGIDSTFMGKVYAIDPRINVNTRSLTARATCSNPGKVLLPGAFAKVEIVLESLPDALMVPADALTPDIKGEKLLISRNGMVKTIYVKTGVRTDREVEVSEGLMPGDTILTTGLLQLRDDMPVQVRLDKDDTLNTIAE